MIPKKGSMHEDPLPNMDPNKKFYAGDNQNRVSGQAVELKHLNIHAWEAFKKGHDVHMQAAPSQAELLYKNYKINKEKLKVQTKDDVMEKYGNAASNNTLPRELLLGQSEKEVEYDCAGRTVKGQKFSNQIQVRRICKAVQISVNESPQSQPTLTLLLLLARWVKPLKVLQMHIKILEFKGKNIRGCNEAA